MQYRRKTVPVRAVQIRSLDVADLPDWARRAQKDEEIFVRSGDALDYSSVPFPQDWVIGCWIVEVSEPGFGFDCRLLTDAEFSELYEPAA